MLNLQIPKYYKVKRGDTVRKVASLFSLPPSLIVYQNGLTKEVREGQILRLFQEGGNLYTVKLGDSKKLLCGSEENFLKRNGTTVFYPGQSVFL